MYILCLSISYSTPLQDIFEATVLQFATREFVQFVIPSCMQHGCKALSKPFLYNQNVSTFSYPMYRTLHAWQEKLGGAIYWSLSALAGREVFLTCT